jgi:hypothetical protein
MRLTPEASSQGLGAPRAASVIALVVICLIMIATHVGLLAN